MTRKRSAYRPREVHTNAVDIAINRVRKLKPADVRMQLHLLHTAVREFAAGQHCARHWLSLADAANMTETLAGVGLCRGVDADLLISEIQQALADVHQRHAERGSWTLYSHEVGSLHWLCRLHETQLKACSYGELEAALRTTAERLCQARAGNAAIGTLVIVGEIAA